jgi:membrane protein YqaA with SNARE-associated domain
LAVFTSLFLTAFIAATIFPMQSEALLVTFLIKTEYAPWLLVAVATAGNVLGSTVNWGLGRYIERFKDRKWFPASPQALEKAQAQYHRWGKWSLLLSWVPLIGDPITVMAGVMREKLWVFMSLVFIAKAGRYIAVAWIALRLGA